MKTLTGAPTRTATAFALCFLWTAPRAAPGQDGPGLRITPPVLTISVGEQWQFRAETGHDAGAAQPEVSWRVTPADLADVDARGVIYAHRAGRGRVIARVGGQIATALVHIEPKPAAIIALTLDHETISEGSRTILRAAARTEDGDPLPGAQFTYQSGDSRVAAVDPTGVVTGRREGTAILAATSGAARGEIRIRVTRDRVATLAVSGPRVASTGEVVSLRVIAQDERQLPVTEPPVQWSIAGVGAAIGLDGEFVADRPGTYLITATTGRVTATHGIEVTSRSHDRTLSLLSQTDWQGAEVTAVRLLGDVVLLALRGAGLYAVDITDPARPRRVDSLALGDAEVQDIAVEKTSLVGVLALRGGADGSGLVLLDLSDARHPSVRGHIPPDVFGAAEGIAIEAGLLYAGESRTGRLGVFDISTPGNPRLVGSWSLSPGTPDDRVPLPMRGQHIRRLVVREGLAFLAHDRDGLVVLDVGRGIRGGTPEQPVLVSRLAYAAAGGTYPAGYRVGASTVRVVGNTLLLGDGVFPTAADAESDPWPGRGLVRVMDVSDPTQPWQTAVVGLADHGNRGLWMEDGLLAVAFDGGGVRVLDATGPLRGDLLAQGREIGTLRTSPEAAELPRTSTPVGLDGQGDLLVVADRFTGLWLARIVREEVP